MKRLHVLFFPVLALFWIVGWVLSIFGDDEDGVV